MICLAAALGAVALGDGMSFRHYTSADGLPSNCIRDIVQDDCGFMWFATDGGLARFDGHEFKVFEPSGVEGASHVDNYVSSLAMAGEWLYVATDNGLLRYDREAECLEPVRLAYGDGSEACLCGTVRSLKVDLRGYLWAGMSQGGVFRISPSLTVTHYDLPGTTNVVGTLFVDRRGDVWATGSYTTQGLFRYNTSADCFDVVNVMVDGENVEIHSMAIAEDDNNRLWIGLWTDGLLCFDPFTGMADAVKAQGDALFHIHSITPCDDGRILIGTDPGLTVYSPDDGSFSVQDHDELKGESISGRFIYPITRDSEGGLWVGTFYAGVNYQAPDIRHFEAARHSRFVNSVSGNIISSFCEDRRGNIYIGSEDGGVCRLDVATGRYNMLPGPGTGGCYNVHSLCMDGDDLWIGTYSDGVKIYDTVTGRMKRDFSNSGISASYSIFRDRQGNMWVTTMNAITRYDRGLDTFVEVLDIGALTSDIDQDAAGNLWFSTQGRGIYRYQPHTASWKNYTVADTAGALIHNHVSGIDIDARGNMWVATGNGMARYRPETDDFEDADIELPDRMISFVKAIGNDLWAGTGRGLVRYRRGEETMRYTVADGLSDNQFALNAVFAASDGSVYAGTINGYTRFDPGRTGRNTVVPEIRFTGLDIGGRHVSVGDPRLPCSLNSIDRLELGPDVYSLGVSFAAMSYANPENNAYMYRLDGFDKEWMTADNTNRATYTNLPPGDYVLRVKASNNDKVWNEAGISLPIHIAPHWYSSWPMKLVYILLTLCIVALAAYVVVKRNGRRHREEIDRVKAAKEREVYEAKLNFFTMIAHEIRTPVSLIIGPLESIMKSDSGFTVRQNDDFDIIHRNSRRLLFLVNQLLDFKKVENLAMGAKYAPHDIPGLVESVAERFRPSLTHMGVALNVDMPDEVFDADVDAEALTKLVSNLLNNARKFTKSLVDVVCTVNHDDDTFTIMVSDDGVGISDADIKRIFKPFVQVNASEQSPGGTGLGLSIVKRVVKIHNGRIEVKSQPGEGACFIVTLPLRQAGALPALPYDAAGGGGMCPVAESCSGDESVVTADERPVMLVTDDNPDLIHFLSGYFSSSYTVITASSADEAIVRLGERNIDLIVSDWMMPGMSGIDFCRHVRANRSTSHIPFLLLTAKTDEGSKIEGMNCGADAYVEKPFSIDYLAARINNLLEMRLLLRQRFSSTPLEPIETLAANPVDSEFLSQLTALIEDNFSNTDLSVDFLAHRLGISRSGLYAKIRTLADSTPNELIQLTRLKRAAQLLTEGKYRINEICYMVGFNSPSYFTKCFQKQFGMKPGEFRG